METTELIEPDADTDHVAHAILKGIKKANKKYETWTEGSWLSDAGIENMMQVYVAESCYSAVASEGLQVHVEASFAFFFDRDDTRRADIAITDEEYVPRFIVELKRSNGGHWRDVDKFKDLLIRLKTPSRNGLRAVYWGLFVPWKYSHQCKSLKSAEERAKSKFEELATHRLLNISWTRGYLGRIDIENGDGSTTEWRASALVATVTRKP